MGEILLESLIDPATAIDSSRLELLASAGSREDLPVGAALPVERSLPKIMSIVLDPGTVLNTVSSPSAAHATPSKDDPSRDDDLGAREYGIAIHALFETIHFIEDGLLDDQLLHAVLSRTSPGRSEAWRAGVIQEFQRMIDHAGIRSLLSRRPDVMTSVSDLEVEADREVSWLRRTAQGELQEGVLDRIILTRREGGPVEALVIDWKTDRVSSGDQVMHAERYRPQLQAYREAVCELTGLPIDQVGAVVVFVRDGILVPLES